ncbi:MAG: hypothetical protein ABUK01_04315 [Leptospirales bacterium]
MAKKIQTFEEYEKQTISAAEFFNKKEYNKALEQFLLLSEYNYDNFKVHETISVIYLKLDRVEEAQKEYDIVIELMKKQNINLSETRSFAEIINEFEDIETLQGKYEDLTANEESKETEKKSTRLPIQIGMQFMAQGEYEKAIEFLNAHKEKYFVTP